MKDNRLNLIDLVHIKKSVKEQIKDLKRFKEEETRKYMIEYYQERIERLEHAYNKLQDLIINYKY